MSIKKKIYGNYAVWPGFFLSLKSESSVRNVATHAVYCSTDAGETQRQLS